MKISQLELLNQAISPANDLLQIVDFSDKTMASSGTNKKITVAQLFTDTDFTGTVTSSNTTSDSLTQGALWLKGGTGAIVLDNGGHKRIGWNDGANLSIRSGNYYTGTVDHYAVETGASTTGGAAKITLTSDGIAANGEINFSVAANGTKDTTVSYSNVVRIATDRFTVNGTGVNVGIGIVAPAAKLNVVDNSANDAVRITQTGTGNALVVEDETSPDSTPLAISNAGRLLVGHTAAIAGTAGTNSYIQVHGLTNAASSAGLYDWQNVAIAGPIFNFNKSKGVSAGVRGAVASGDRLGTLVFGGDDGTNFITAASINCLVDGIPATNGMPGRLTFSTTPSGTAAQIERMRISNDGIVFIGNGSAIDAPAAGVISSTGGSGLNTAGASLTIRGGAGTGTGAGGAVIFNTAPAGTAGSTANTTVQRACILPTGQIIVGNATSPFTTRLGGATTPPSNSEYAPVFQILSNTAGSGLQRNTGASLIARFSNDGDGPRQFFAKSRNTTVGSHTVVSTTDSIGQLSFGGSDGSKIIECARISTIVDVRSIVNATAILSGKRYRILTLGDTTTMQWTALGVATTPAVGTIFDAIINADSSYGTGTVYLEPETDIVPGAMTFSTGATASPAERMRITSSGNVGIGTTAPNSKALLHLNSTNSGFLPPAMNNTQRDAMGTVPAGLMIYNNTSGVNAIQFHNGTAWQQLSFTAAS